MTCSSSEKGEFSFRIPKKTDLRIVLEAAMGHRAEYILKLDEMNREDVSPDAVQPGDLKALQPEGKVPVASREDLEKIRAVVEEALDAWSIAADAALCVKRSVAIECNKRRENEHDRQPDDCCH